MKHKKLRHILGLLTNNGSYWINHDCFLEKTNTILLRRIENEIKKLKEYNKVLKENEEKVLHEPNGRKDFSFDHADVYDDDSFADWNC